MKEISFYIIISIFFISSNPIEKANPELDKSDITEEVLVGAIRWDAWNGGEVTRQVERTLGPKKYHGRLP